MKKFLIIAFFMMSALLMFSNAAKNVVLNYDQAKGELAVDAQHKVTNTSSHYIKEITYYLNGNLVEKKEFKSQQTKTDQTTTFKVTVKSGDKIMVSTLCSWGGTKKAELTVK